MKTQSDIRARIDQTFMRVTEWIYIHRWISLALLLLFLMGLILQIPKLKIEISSEGFFHKNDPTRVVYDKFRDQYGRDSLIMIALEPENIFEPVFLSLFSRD